MEAPSRYCGCTTQPVPELLPALRTTAPPRRSFAKIRHATTHMLRTTIFRRDLPLSFFTALLTSWRAFNAFDFLPNTTYHLDTTYRPSLFVRINPT